MKDKALVACWFGNNVVGYFTLNLTLRLPGNRSFHLTTWDSVESVAPLAEPPEISAVTAEEASSPWRKPLDWQEAPPLIEGVRRVCRDPTRPLRLSPAPCWLAKQPGDSMLSVNVHWGRPRLLFQKHQCVEHGKKDVSVS